MEGSERAKEKAREEEKSKREGEREALGKEEEVAKNNVLSASIISRECEDGRGERRERKEDVVDWRQRRRQQQWKQRKDSDFERPRMWV